MNEIRPSATDRHKESSNMIFANIAWSFKVLMIVHALTCAKASPVQNSFPSIMNEEGFLDSDTFKKENNLILSNLEMVRENNSASLHQDGLHPSKRIPLYYTNDITQEKYEGWPVAEVKFHHPVQSPVDIIPKRAVTLELPVLLVGQPDLQDTVAVLFNSGNTVFVFIYDDTANRPYLKGGPLKQRYIFEQMHFHWGKEDDWGSEHFLDGNSYSAEIHLVHYNSKYSTFEEAAQEPDGLAVFTVFAKVGHVPNPLLSPLERLLPNITDVGASVAMNAEEALQWPASALRTVTEYYTYPGSLTTKPFSENVMFIVLPRPITLSHKQLAAFRELNSVNGGRILQNRRQLQPLHHRPIVRSVHLAAVPSGVDSDQERAQHNP